MHLSSLLFTMVLENESIVRNKVHIRRYTEIIGSFMVQCSSFIMLYLHFQSKPLKNL